MKPRKAGSIEDLLTIICAAIGYDGAAAAVGKSEPHVRRWTDPDDDSLPNMKQMLLLEKAYIEAMGSGLLVATLTRWLRPIVPTEIKCEPMPVALMDVTATVGLLAHAVKEAWKDKAVSPQERDVILRALQNLRIEIDELERAAYQACPVRKAV